MRHKHIYFSYTLLLIAIIGFLLLFPFPFNNRYTCIYHRLQGNHFMEASQASYPGPVTHIHDSSMPAHELLDAYLGRFAFLWWGFITLAIYAIYNLKKQKLKKHVKWRN